MWKKNGGKWRILTKRRRRINLHEIVIARKVQIKYEHPFSMKETKIEIEIEKLRMRMRIVVQSLITDDNL